MTRVVNLKLSMNEARDQCAKNDIGISALEALPSGGVRLVCMSGDGAEQLRRVLKSKLIKGEAPRANHAPERSPIGGWPRQA
jgi:hypothetical protein